MSDAIEAERKRAIAAIHWVFNADGTVGERAMAQEAIHKINDPTFMPALTAYEAAKGGGVGVKPLEPVARQIIHELAADIRDRLSHEEGSANWRNAQRIVELSRPVSALTSPASGERDAVIEVTVAMIEAGAVAIDALWSEGQDRGPAFAETEREYQAHCRSTACAALVAALRMEGK